MDFADATLVLLAQQLSVFDILPLDRRGFSVHQSPAGTAFRLVLT
jgi:predicted nucleic acid-binding protein